MNHRRNDIKDGLPGCCVLAAIILFSACRNEPSADTKCLNTCGTEKGFHFRNVREQDVHMQQLMANAMLYVTPGNGTINEEAAYPVEGWNHGQLSKLSLRGFTQSTSIGEWIELLANIAAGYADTPVISHQEALDLLAASTASLMADQENPELSAKGLMCNFIGLSGGDRVPPLTAAIRRDMLVDAIGKEQTDAIWPLLVKRGVLEDHGSGYAGVKRFEDYNLFDGDLAPYQGIREQVLSVIDQRVPTLIYGDNINLTASIAKAIGALLHPDLAGNAQAEDLRDTLERFIERQQEGYDHLYDAEKGLPSFGWYPKQDMWVGWRMGDDWSRAHQGYYVNEFRGPHMFVALRYNLPRLATACQFFKMKGYVTRDNEVLSTYAAWDGSAFQLLGLTMFMQEPVTPGWSDLVHNATDIMLDYVEQHRLPGLLSESYTGNGLEYTGHVGFPDLCAGHPEDRILDAPSLYTLGVAYSLNPDGVEALLAREWDIISGLLTDHGPWEGYNTTHKKFVPAQTSAHTLSLILGGLDSGHDNMRRYLEWKGLADGLAQMYAQAEPVNVLSDVFRQATWSSQSELEVTAGNEGLKIKGHDIAEGGLIFESADLEGVALNGLYLTLRLKLNQPVEAAALNLLRVQGGSIEVECELLPVTEWQTLHIPFPASSVMEGVNKIEFNLTRAPDTKTLDFVLSDLRFDQQ